jgi:putative ABC transport system permease protein
MAFRQLALALRFAIRELRAGLSGFYVFLACIALGVGAITGVNAVAAAIASGIAERGQEILGGDLALSISQNDLPGPVAELLAEHGATSLTRTLRAMARRPDGAEQILVELKAIDGAYPLYGEVKSGEETAPVNQMAADEVWVEPLLLQRLGLSRGEDLALGNASFTISGTVTEEPDRLSEGLSIGPRVMMSLAGLDKAGLVRPGSLYRSTLALRLDDPGPAHLESLLETLRAQYSGAGLRIRSRENAAPSLSRNIERFSQFLTLVGLAALIVGGVGVANSVRAFMETKRDVIATLKSLGASGGLIFAIYLIQIMIIAAIGVAIGICIGLLAPLAARGALTGLVPFASDGGLGMDPLSILLGAAYGMLTAFIFAVWPLGRARDIRAADLFRAAGFGGSGPPRLVYLAMLAGGLAILAGIAIYFSGSREIAITFLVAIAFSFVLLRVVALAIQWLASRLPVLPWPGVRMAVANIHRRGAATPSVVLSLGLGLALIVALALIDASLRNQLNANIPSQAPSFFFVDIQNDEYQPFRDRVAEIAPDGTLDAVPMLRGRITALKGIAAEDYKTDAGAWVLRGDRGITYSPAKPENATLTRGTWWPADYSGEPLVSFAAEEAGELDLDIGDMIEVNVLGRRIEAKIANLRAVEWETLSINFVMVFSPNTFAGAPHAWLATLTRPDGEGTRESLDERDGSFLRQITDTFPTVTSVRIRDAIDMVNGLIRQISVAIRAASAVALISSFLVLAGALAAGNHVRGYDAVVLKTLGAGRPFLIRAMIYEYAMLGTATAIFGLVAGAIASWYVVTQVMEFTSIFAPVTGVLVILFALAATIGLGLAGTWRILGRKPGPLLREP